MPSRTSLFWSVILFGYMGITHAAKVQCAGRTGGIAACGRLAQEFSSQLFMPNTPTYANQSALPWSETCLRSPQCVFIPNNANDIAGALRIIKEARSPFAVISGGHMPVPGAQSTDDGVLISLEALTALTFNEDKSIAQVTPGHVWQDVYSWVSQSGLAVNGGRYGQVGVGGLLMGGGIGYFGSQFGWGCDSVVQYEVVLANSSVVLVNATSFPDLFWALKGGHNYFGIVTRYDMKTFPATDAFFSGTIWSAPATDAWFDALNAYYAPGGGVDDIKAAIMPIVALTPGDGTYEVISLEFYADPVASPQVFENFTKIDAPYTLKQEGVAPWPTLAGALDTPAFAGRDERQLFWSVSFKPDPRAISIANHTIFDGALTALKDVANCSITFSYQPISKAWVQASQAAGGNALDLDPHQGTFVSGLISTTWSNAADDEIVNNFSRKAAATIAAETVALGLGYDFVFLNDAGHGQSPFETYGSGRSLPALRAIQKKYDPKGVLLNLLAHGFPLQ